MAIARDVTIKGSGKRASWKELSGWIVKWFSDSRSVIKKLAWKELPSTFHYCIGSLTAARVYSIRKELEASSHIILITKEVITV